MFWGWGIHSIVLGGFGLEIGGLDSKLFFSFSPRFQLAVESKEHGELYLTMLDREQGEETRFTVSTQGPVGEGGET